MKRNPSAQELLLSRCLAVLSLTVLSANADATPIDDNNVQATKTSSSSTETGTASPAKDLRTREESVSSPVFGEATTTASTSPAGSPQHHIQMEITPASKTPSSATPQKQTEQPDAAQQVMSPQMAAMMAKKWNISGSFSQALGSSILAANSDARKPALTLTAVVGGSYELTKLWEGALRVGGRLRFDKQVTQTFNDIGVGPAQMIVWDPRVRLNGVNLYTEKNSKIVFGAVASLDLPLGMFSLPIDRVLRADLGVSLRRAFKIGGSTLIVWVAETLRKDFGPAVPSVDQGEWQAYVNTCRAGNFVGDSSSCALGIVNTNFGLTHELNFALVTGKWTFAIQHALINRWLHNAGATGGTIDTVAARDIFVESSTFASNSRLQAALATSINATYNLTTNVALFASLDTAYLDSPYIFGASGNKTIRFPYWDIHTPGANNSSISIGVSAFY